MLQNELIKYVIEKLVRTFVSLKAWGLISITIISSYLVYNKSITGEEWSTTIISTYGIIYGLREISKSYGTVKLKKK